MNAETMISAAAAVGSAPAAPVEQKRQEARQRIAEEADRASRYRLVIEEGSRSGSFVYKTLDRVTGEVIRQLPREKVVEMSRDEAYGAGAVVDTRA